MKKLIIICEEHCRVFGDYLSQLISMDDDMEHEVKVTVLDKKLFPELQAEYCAVPDSGKCPCYNVGDEFLFYRNDERDDYWHMVVEFASGDG